MRFFLLSWTFVAVIFCAVAAAVAATSDGRETEKNKTTEQLQSKIDQREFEEGGNVFPSQPLAVEKRSSSSFTTPGSGKFVKAKCALCKQEYWVNVDLQQSGYCPPCRQGQGYSDAAENVKVECERCQTKFKVSPDSLYHRVGKVLCSTCEQRAA